MVKYRTEPSCAFSKRYAPENYVIDALSDTLKLVMGRGWVSRPMELLLSPQGDHAERYRTRCANRRRSRVSFPEQLPEPPGSPHPELIGASSRRPLSLQRETTPSALTTD